MANVFTVILAGGSGSRFWPASRRLLPKQLLPLGPGEGSLIAETTQRMSAFSDRDHMLVATGAHLVEATRRALPDLSESAFMAEPVAKNTAPCIGWAAERIARVDEQAIVVVVPSDQHVSDPPAFARAIETAIETAEKGVVVTLGIRPTRPETGYGYLHAGQRGARGAAQLRAFREKPDLATAKQYVESGEYFWNAGIFVFPAGLMLEHFRSCLPEMWAGLMQVREAARSGQDTEASAVARYFAAAESISIDFGVMEKIGKLGQIEMVPADCGWSDLGSFQAAWELSARDHRGNVLHGDVVQTQSRDSYVLDLRKGARGVTALVGVSDLVVVQTDDALLVAHRDQCQEVKAIVDALKAAGREDLL